LQQDLDPLDTPPKVRLLAMILRLELRLALRLVGLMRWPRWWILAPLWLLLAVTVVTLVGLVALDHLGQRLRRKYFAAARRRRSAVRS
jgi:hypothetical protein